MDLYSSVIAESSFLSKGMSATSCSVAVGTGVRDSLIIAIISANR